MSVMPSKKVPSKAATVPAPAVEDSPARRHSARVAASATACSTPAAAGATTSPTAAADTAAAAAIHTSTIPTKRAPPKATVLAVEESPARRHSTRAVAARANTSPTATADAVAAAIVHASAAPPSTSDSATAALLAKPKPGRTGKTTAKDKADGAGNTVPPDMSLFPSDSDDSDYKAASEDPDSDEAAAALLAKPNPGGTGKKPSNRKGKDAKNTTAMQAEKPHPAKKAKTITEKVCLLIF